MARDQAERRQKSSTLTLEQRRDEDDVGLLERERELEAIDATLKSAATGAGRSVAILGPPGVGKTRILDVALGLATRRGFATLEARGTPLESEFAFGIARQVFSSRVGKLTRAELRAATTVPAHMPSTHWSPPSPYRDRPTAKTAFGPSTASTGHSRISRSAVRWRSWSTTSSGPTTCQSGGWPTPCAASMASLSPSCMRSEPATGPLRAGPLSAILSLPETIAVAPHALSATSTAGWLGHRLGRDTTGSSRKRRTTDARQSAVPSLDPRQRRDGDRGAVTGGAPRQSPGARSSPTSSNAWPNSLMAVSDSPRRRRSSVTGQPSRIARRSPGSIHRSQPMRRTDWSQPISSCPARTSASSIRWSGMPSNVRSEHTAERR